jgi:hypothetical protein
MSDADVVRGHVPCGKLATVFSGGAVVLAQQIARTLRSPKRGHDRKGIYGNKLRVCLETVLRGTVIASDKKSSAIG